MEVPQKTKNRTAIGSSNSTLGYISEEIGNTNLKRYRHTGCTIALFTMAKICKQPKLLTSLSWG